MTPKLPAWLEHDLLCYPEAASHVKTLRSEVAYVFEMQPTLAGYGAHKAPMALIRALAGDQRHPSRLTSAVRSVRDDIRDAIIITHGLKRADEDMPWLAMDRYRALPLWLARIIDDLSNVPDDFVTHLGELTRAATGRKPDLSELLPQDFVQAAPRMRALSRDTLDSRERDTLETLVACVRTRFSYVLDDATAYLVIDDERGIVSVCRTAEDAFDLLDRWVAAHYDVDCPEDCEHVEVRPVPFGSMLV